MPEKRFLELKPLESKDTESVRIYNLARDACERLNNYLLDFFESIAILNEKKEKLWEKKKSAELKEVEESIAFVYTKIEEVTASMEEIADQMDFLVEIKKEFS